MLTVDYDKLGLRAGDLLLDLGCGFGRHAFEGIRRGASVVACDMAEGELGEVMAMFEAMALEGEIPAGVATTTARTDALHMPFPDDTFDRIIASEVIEHIPGDDAALVELTRILRPGGTIAVTVPAQFSERICWKLTDEYYAPKAEGGHLRIYSEDDMRSKLTAAGLTVGESHKAHALHAPYWWLKCAVGIENDDNPLVKAYHKLLVWDITKAPAVTRLTEKALNPLIGKSMAIYATKPTPGAVSAATVAAKTPAAAR